MKNLYKFILLFIGGIGGFLYYKFIGCYSGSCPITSNPYLSVIFGALIVYLLVSGFFPETKKSIDKKNDE